MKTEALIVDREGTSYAEILREVKKSGTVKEERRKIKEVGGTEDRKLLLMIKET